MRFTRSYKRAKWLVLLAWMSSIAFSAPIIFFFSTKETEQFGTQCWLELAQPWQWQVYVVLVSLSIFILPALIIATCYTAITLTIWKRGRVMQPPVVTFAILPRGELQSVASIAHTGTQHLGLASTAGTDGGGVMRVHHPASADCWQAGRSSICQSSNHHSSRYSHHTTAQQTTDSNLNCNTTLPSL